MPLKIGDTYKLEYRYFRPFSGRLADVRGPFNGIMQYKFDLGASTSVIITENGHDFFCITGGTKLPVTVQAI